MAILKNFNRNEIIIVNDSAAMSEELVSNFYKMSANQWLRHKYDIKTLADLDDTEIVHGPFAQIIRYKGQKKDSILGSSTYDFYKICLQDHTILSTVNTFSDLDLFSFILYIITHELIHIVRFSRFMVNFDAPPHKKLTEEITVHEKTYEILSSQQIPGLENAFKFYKKLREPLDELQNS